MIRLGKAEDGRLIIGSNEKFPAHVRRVEYYKEQRLMMLVYENGESDLMTHEIPKNEVEKVERSPAIVVIAMSEENKEPYGYNVPLIQVGV